MELLTAPSQTNLRSFHGHLQWHSVRQWHSNALAQQSWDYRQINNHAHNAVLSGIKTQSLATSQSGHGAYNQLVFDDTPEQGRTSLQQHQAPHQGNAELNLGHLKHQTDNQRKQTVGQGIELK